LVFNMSPEKDEPTELSCWTRFLRSWIPVLIILSSSIMLWPSTNSIYKSAVGLRVKPRKIAPLKIPVYFNPQKSNASRVEFDEKKGQITKHFTKALEKYQPLERELCVLGLLQRFHWVPRIISHTSSTIVMSYVGQPLTKETIPLNWKKQLKQILADMRSVGVRHNGIVRTDGILEIMEKDGTLYLVDFGWATVNGSLSCAPGIPDEHPSFMKNFDDRKVFQFIQLKLFNFTKYLNSKRKVGSEKETPRFYQGEDVIKVRGYQVYDISLGSNELIYRKKPKKFRYIQDVLRSISSVSSSLVDIGCSGGEITFIAQRLGYSHIDSLDHDTEYISMLEELVNLQGLEEVVFPQVFSFGDPFPTADVVVMGAIINWVFSMTSDFGDFGAIMSYLFERVRNFLLIEWVDVKDSEVKSFDQLSINKIPTKEEYNVKNFEKALMRHGSIISKHPLDEQTRVMYLIQKTV